MPQTQYTTRADMELLFTRLGVNLRTARYGDSTDAIDFFIDDASTTIDQYASQWYYPADLATSRWVKIRATWMACYLLSQVAGNPSLFYTRYDLIMQELDKVQQGLLPIPELNTRADMVPSMGNIEHDPRFREKTLRVETEVSTGENGKRNESYTILPDWMW